MIYELLNAKYNYLDAQKSGDETEMLIQREIGKYIKAMLKLTSEYLAKDVPFKEKVDEAIRLDKSTITANESLDNWRNIFAYASILSSDEKAQPDIFNKVRGITYDLILRDIELIRQACRKYGENVKIELKGNSTTNSLTGQNVYYKNDGDGVSSINGLPSDVDPNLGESRGSGADTFLRMNDYI